MKNGLSRFSLVLAAATLAFAASVLLQQPGVAPAVKAPQFSAPAETSLKRPQPLLLDSSYDWQVDIQHQQTTDKLTALTETLGSGVCAIDANRDGWMDLFFVGGGGHTRHYGRESWWHKQSGNKLLLNRDGLRLEDTTDAAGLKSSAPGMGCAVADLDNDGWDDLIVTGIEANTLYRNNTDGSFVDVTASSGISADSWSTGASPGDYNNDGLIDIYISNYISYQQGARTFERSKGFDIGKVSFDATLYDPLPNKLYLNLGNFQFREVAEQAGVSNSVGRSLGARWLHLNNDDWLDLLVINDEQSPSQVFISREGKQFELATKAFALLEAPAAHDALVDDLNHDGDSDILLTRNHGLAPVFTSLKSMNKTGQPAAALLDNSWQSGLAHKNRINLSSWGATSGDFDNDGQLDIFLANGAIYPDMDSKFVPQGQPNYLFMAQANGAFHAYTKPSTDSFAYSSRGSITTDLNNDGSLELVVSNNNGPLQIFNLVTPTRGNWIGLDLSTRNRPDVWYGAQLEIRLAQQTLLRRALPKQGFLSQSDSRLHLGLGSAERIENIKIHWRDGTSSNFQQVEANHYYQVDKAGQALTPGPDNRPYIALLQTSLRALDAQTRRLLARFLLASNSSDNLSKLLLLWDAADQSGRNEMLQALRQSWSPQYLALLLRALDSAVVELQLPAIDLLRQLELEAGVAWLVPLLQAQDARVQCAAASSFEFFFAEEEAVTQRKKLAVSPLIRMLDNNSEAATLCAIRALTSAEHKRAVLPLLKLVQTDPRDAVRVAAISALGLVRDSSAAAPLSEILGRPQQQSAAVIGTTLIALRRLNQPAPADYFSRLALAKPGPNGSISPLALQVLNYLLQQADGIVLGRNYLLQQQRREFTALLSANLASATPLNANPESAPPQPASLHAADLPTEITLTLLQSIQHGSLDEHAGFARQQLQSSRTDIRKQAYLSLLSMPKQAHYALGQLLESEEGTLLQEVFAAQPHSSIRLTPAHVELWQRRLQRQTGGSNQASSEIASFNILPYLSAKSRQQLVAGSIGADPGNRWLTQLGACEELQRLLSPANDASQRPNNAQLHYTGALCQFQQNAVSDTDQRQQLQARLLVKQILESAQYTEQQKCDLLLLASSTDAFIAANMLVDFLPRVAAHDLPRAIQTLALYPGSASLIASMWTRLRDHNTPLQIRLASALYLLRTDQDTVIDYVNRELFPHVTG